MYDSNIFLLIFRTSGLASRAVPRIIASISRARASFSRSGGLHEFRQVKVPSATISLSVAALSLIFCTKKGRTEASWVDSIMVKIALRARLMTTLFVLPQTISKLGIKSGISCSKSCPSPFATEDSMSRAVPHSRVRSEFMALVIGRWKFRMALTTSVGAKS